MLSDEAKNLRTWLDMQRTDGGGPVMISPEGIETIITAIDSLINLAKKLEALGIDGHVSLAADHHDGENIIRFPIVHRPIPKTPEGGAA